MAKIYIEGDFPKRIDNFVLYRWGSKVVIKMVSGFTTEALDSAPKYELSRKNASEFGRVSSLCKQVRVALSGIIPKQNNLTVVNSFTKKMREVMTYDITNPRGERQLANALITEEGRQSLVGYEFNPSANIVLDYTLTDELLLINNKEVTFPSCINHIGFRIHQLAVDFGIGDNALLSSDWTLKSKTELSKTIEIAVPNQPESNGVVFMILETQFYEWVDGVCVPVVEDGGKSVLVVDAMEGY